MTRRGRFEFYARGLLSSTLLLYGLIVRADGLGASAPPYGWTTWVGVPCCEGESQDGAGIAARFSSPRGVAVGSDGAIYVADTYNSTIRKIVNGVTSTLAGASKAYGHADGTGTAARFQYPTGIAVDAAQNVYVADSSDHTIRKVTPGGVVSTLAGWPGLAGARDGNGAIARFNNPIAVAVDASGDLFVADSGNFRVRRITPAGVVTTFAGSSHGTVDGTGTSAKFSSVMGLEFAPDGTLIVSQVDAIRKISPAAVVTTLITASPTSAPFAEAAGVAVDAAGNVLVADGSTQSIVMVSPTGVPSRIAGGNLTGPPDGTTMTARFDLPIDLAVEASGAILVAEVGSNSIRQIADGNVVTIAGLSMLGVSDGTGSSAQLRGARAIVVDDTGNLLVAGYSAIRRISTTGVVTTYAGDNWQAGNVDGPISMARFEGISGLARTTDGSLYVGQDFGRAIRKISRSGQVTTIAGAPGVPGCTDGLGAASRFQWVSDIALAPSGLLWAVDEFCDTIRTIDDAGNVTTVAGLAGATGSADGVGSDARFGLPGAIVVDSTGTAYVADTWNHTIRKIAPDFTVTTLAGLAGQSGSVDGHGSSARFYAPVGIALDLNGDLIVTEWTAVRRVTTAGDVTTIGGGSGVARILDGLGTQAQFQDTDAVAVDSAGVIYVGDTGVIRRGHPSFVQSPSIVAHPSPQSKVIGAAATFSVHAIGIPEPALQWEISTNGGIDWSQVIDGGVFKGASTSTLTITAVAGGMSGSLLRCVASNATGAAASAPALLTVFDVVTSPAMLMFGGTKDQAGNLVHVTPPQTVTVKFGADVPAAAWQAFSDQPWLQLTHAAGTGTAQLQASIANPGLFPDLLTRLSANVTIAIAGFAPVTMPVTLFVSGSSSVPYGQIDAPLPNTTGISGALAVSGWTLDDIGVQSVKIYRNCLAEEPQSHCGPPSGFPGSAKYVYLGEAAFLEDARPDIAEQFSYSPASHRGGWGFQLLTNMLPRTEGPYQPYGGQGPITLYAIATDVEGHVTFLARDWTDTDPVQTSAPITLDNDHLARPFGTIDTPSQGESIVETLLANFGWALTPDSNAGYSIPTDGSTMFVFVDGVPIGNVTYSQCRGDVGNPPPAGVFCNDDVANVFGNVAPQPPLTPRTSNPSPFLNLDAGRGAIGSFLLDLSSYEPGLHTIAWSVTDSAGRVEGIGSRFFRYWPSAPRPAATRAPSSKTSPQRTLRTGAKWLADGVSDRRDGRVLVRTGFDLNQRYTAVPPLAAERAVTIPQLGRVEAHLGAGATVTMPLPIGARLDRETGVFTWVPPVGYLGPYAITFARPDGPFVLNVTIGR